MRVRDFVDQHYLHYNARQVRAAARAYEAHIKSGGKMFVTLAGAMSTARIGRVQSTLVWCMESAAQERT